MPAHAVHVWPTTRLGRWSVVLALAFLVLAVIWTSLPGAGRLAVLTGAAAGVAALVAVVRRGERGLAVLAAFAPLLGVVGFIAAELVG